MKKRAMTVITLVTALMLMCAAPLWAEGGGKVNINTATVEQLMTLDGVGRGYADRIVEHREQNGPFKTPDDILQVKGIGQKTLDANKDRIVVKDKK
ncbi:MAG: hypothetical protein VR64_25000 [Desulfatitalea sp. BRH_c12]|nr:MAG: hypothetical protein VR64_25000 [Desulfatitalea sp. BRH_c12]